jgi:hypothetical protein
MLRSPAEADTLNAGLERIALRAPFRSLARWPGADTAMVGDRKRQFDRKIRKVEPVTRNHEHRTLEIDSMRRLSPEFANSVDKMMIKASIATDWEQIQYLATRSAR